MAKRIFTSLVSYNEKDIAARAVKPVNEIMKSINHFGPRILRKAVHDTLKSNPYLYPFRELADKLKTENREFGEAKAGSGLSFRMKDNELRMRVMLKDSTIKSYLGIDGFYKFQRLTTGEYTLNIAANKVTPIRVHEGAMGASKKHTHSREYRSTDGDPDNTKIGVSFINPSAPIKGTYLTDRGPIEWEDEAQELAFDRLIERINRMK